MIPFTVAKYYLGDKGLELKTSEFNINPQQLRKAYNVHFYETGSLTKRNGYAKRVTNPVTGSTIITGLYEFVLRNGTSNYITACDKLYTSINGDTNFTSIAGGLTFTTGTEGENFMSMVTFDNKVIGTNGIENPWYWDGTNPAAALPGSPPVAPIIAIFQNFVFLAGNATNPYRLYFSNDGNETVWTATDYIDIGDLTNPITGLAVLFGKLYIFTRRAIYELRGYDRNTFTVDEVTLSTGCVAYKSIVKVDNNLVFLSDRGIYSFDGINVHYLSRSIEPYIELLNYNRTPYVVAELYKAKNQIWFSVSTGSNANNNNVICMTYGPSEAESYYGIQEKSVAFAIYTGMAFNAFGLERSISQLDRLFAGGYNGLVYEQDRGTNDDGNGIDFNVQLPTLDMGSPETFKRFRYMWIFNKQSGNYNLTITYQTDFGLGGTSQTLNLSVVGSGSFWGSMTWGTDVWGGSTIITSRVGFKAHGHTMSLILSNSNADQPITVKGLSILAQMKGMGHR